MIEIFSIINYKIITLSKVHLSLRTKKQKAKEVKLITIYSYLNVYFIVKIKSLSMLYIDIVPTLYPKSGDLEIVVTESVTIICDVTITDNGKISVCSAVRKFTF